MGRAEPPCLNMSLSGRELAPLTHTGEPPTTHCQGTLTVHALPVPSQLLSSLSQAYPLSLLTS
jgi:hypothetical protein